MSTIDMGRLERERDALSRRFQEQRPYRYLVIDDFLHREAALKIHREYPAIDRSWIDCSRLNTSGKWAQPIHRGTVAEAFFAEVNAPAFRNFLGSLTGIDDLIADDECFGAGYHQIVDGGFVNIHVDFNKLGNLDRRLNLLVYMNPEWRDEYGGFLELWDMAGRKRIANIAPILNRCVIFETNEISFHGHPTALRTGGTIARKSLSVYFYTHGRDDIVPVDSHNSRYVNTSGLVGALRTFRNGVRHFCRKMGLSSPLPHQK
jgi:hypothetical protein